MKHSHQLEEQRSIRGINAISQLFRCVRDIRQNRQYEIIISISYMHLAA